MSIESFESEAELFYKATGFLAPGKSESPAAIGQIDFDREEVRRLLKKAWDAGRRTPAPSSEVERAVRMEAALREIAEIPCECDGESVHHCHQIVASNALHLAPIPEEKPSPLEAARSAVIEAAKDFSDFWYEEAIKSGRGSRMVDALARLAALSGPAKGGASNKTDVK